MKQTIAKIRELKSIHEIELKRLYKLRTKKAIEKSRDKLRDLEFEFTDLLDSIMPKQLKLTRELLCMNITGTGGCGISKGAIVQFDCSYSGIFSCQDTMFKTDFTSLGWTKSALECVLESIEGTIK